MSVLLETSVGDIVIDTFFDKVPDASLNFIKLCKLKYYNDSPFFSIQSSFIARTGNPHPSTVSYPADTSIHCLCERTASESSSSPPPEQRLLTSRSCAALSLSHGRRGIVSFTATKGTKTAPDKLYGSQFFITLSDGLGYLDDAGHMIFGGSPG